MSTDPDCLAVDIHEAMVARAHQALEQEWANAGIRPGQTEQIFLDMGVFVGLAAAMQELQARGMLPNPEGIR